MTLDAAESARRGTPFGHRRRAGWPRLRPDVLLVVFAGGCVGGYARYAVDAGWAAARHGFPWPTLAVNLIGAFALAVVLVLVAEVGPSRYLRPLLGTGLCGALTTFSAVVVGAAQLLAHGRIATATGYLAATIIGGLTAAALGLVTGRAVSAHRPRARTGRSAP